MRELEERFLRFSLTCRNYLKSRKWDEVDRVYKIQLARSAGPVGANYIEANENLGKQDLLMHLRISRKEAKESKYWMQHLDYRDRPNQHSTSTRSRSYQTNFIRHYSQALFQLLKHC